MPRKKKNKSLDGNNALMSKDKMEITPQAEQLLIGTAIIEEELLKKAIGEHLDQEPIINPNPISNNPQMLRYNGDNAKQVMEFCGAYHMECHATITNFIAKDPNRNFNYVIAARPGQSIIKDGDTFKVVD